MTRWVRFRHQQGTGFGVLDGDAIGVHEGDMYDQPRASGEVLQLAQVQLLHPTQPSKLIALWNNFRALGDKLKLAVPAEPLYLLKAPSSYLHPGETVRKPAGVAKVAFEGELGIVIGRTCKDVSEAGAQECIFGYTCANDITAADVLNRDASFAQWVRAKSFDGFSPFGPAVATGLDPALLRVRTTLNGELRQDYPISDMRFSAQQLVSLISKDMTLYPGDIISCGTSIGVGSMPPGSTVDVEIDGIGKLSNRFE